MFPPEHLAMFAGNRHPAVTLFDDGLIKLSSEDAIPVLAIGAAGRAAVVLHDPSTLERVVLEPVPKVELVLDYEGDPVPAGKQFLVELGWQPDDAEWFRFGPSWMSNADSLRLPRLSGIELERGAPVAIPIRCLGATTLQMVIGVGSQGGYSGHMVECDPTVITIERKPDHQVFHVKVARDAIDECLKADEDAK